jgi:hypothetical protein
MVLTMQGRRKKKSVIAAVAAVGALALAGSAPASADACVAAEVYTQKPNQTKQYVIGPKECVTPPIPGTLEGISVGVTPGDPATAVVGVKVWTVTPG